jgi:hypothetical protein
MDLKQELISKFVVCELELSQCYQKLGKSVSEEEKQSIHVEIENIYFKLEVLRSEIETVNMSVA